MQMINQQVRPWHVFDAAVLEALRAVPREQFVPARYRSLAFADTAIPLPHGQCMLRPAIEGRLLVALHPQPDAEVLLIGTGSGYLAGVLARLAQRVTAIDKYAELTAAATAQLAAAAVSNATLLTVDYQQYRPDRQFDRILISGSLPVLDERLVDWLTPTGALVVTTGAAQCMTVQRVQRVDSRYSRETVFETVLPPLELSSAATSDSAPFRL
ncbi:MAG: protein-L-isoaspartate O-methyltransferase [Gammaproteobacteria bacterium]|nr:protein-L-isoaspartate O-methyltransferase [Gammaproteobacteria bacterium]